VRIIDAFARRLRRDVQRIWTPRHLWPFPNGPWHRWRLNRYYEYQRNR
jgi:hypothetical protein